MGGAAKNRIGKVCFILFGALFGILGSLYFTIDGFFILWDERDQDASFIVTMGYAIASMLIGLFGSLAEMGLSINACMQLFEHIYALIFCDCSRQLIQDSDEPSLPKRWILPALLIALTASFADAYLGYDAGAKFHPTFGGCLAVISGIEQWSVTFFGLPELYEDTREFFQKPWKIIFRCVALAGLAMLGNASNYYFTVRAIVKLKNVFPGADETALRWTGRIVGVISVILMGITYVQRDRKEIMSEKEPLLKKNAKRYPILYEENDESDVDTVHIINDNEDAHNNIGPLNHFLVFGCASMHVYLPMSLVFWDKIINAKNHWVLAFNTFWITASVIAEIYFVWRTTEVELASAPGKLMDRFSEIKLAFCGPSTKSTEK